MYGERLCNHPAKGGECRGEYGCPCRSDNTPAYNSDTNSWEKMVDGKVVEVPITHKMEEEYCRCCDFDKNEGFVYTGDQNGLGIECCLIKPSPISKRKNPDAPALMQILTEDENGVFHQFEIPVAYCPVCGRKL